MREVYSHVRIIIDILNCLNFIEQNWPNWPRFKAWNLYFTNFEIFSKKVFTSCNRRTGKETFVIENCKNSNAFSNHWKIFFMTKSTRILKIEVFSLHQPLNTCCTIFIRYFIEPWTSELKRQKFKKSWMFKI